MTRAPDLEHPDFADFYDELPLWSAPFAQRILERAPMARGLRILDVGCGSGFLSLEFAQRCGPDSRVWAIDPWPAVMDRLERKLSYHGISNVELVRRDATNTGLPNAIADLVVSNLGINNFDDPDAVLAECRRTLKVGGKLILTTNLSGHMAEVYELLREIAGDDVERRSLIDAQEAHRGSVASVTSRLTAAGFERVRHETSTYPMRFADGTSLMGHWLMRLAFVPSWAAVVGEEAVSVLEQRLDARARDKGELALTIPVALFEATRP